MNILARKSVITIGADSRRMSSYAPRSRYRLPILAVAGLAALSGLLLVACEVASNTDTENGDRGPGNVPGNVPVVVPGDNTGITGLASFNSFQSVGEEIDSDEEDARTDDSFGSSIAWLGDLSEDGFQEVVVGAINDEPLGTGTNNGAIWIVSLNRDGTSRPNPVRTGHGSPAALTIAPNESFGSAVAHIGDRNGDGITDIAVGASVYKYSGRGGTVIPGAVYIFYLNADGTVQPNPKVLTEGQNGIPEEVIARFAFNYNTGFQSPFGAAFGSAVADIGDLNGDGFSDLAVGAPESGGCTLGRVTITGVRSSPPREHWRGSMGALFILLMKEDGEVSAVIRHGRTVDFGGFSMSTCTASRNLPTLDASSRFGSSVVALGDIDGDEVPDLAVSELNSTNPKVHILFMEKNENAGMIKAVKTIVSSDVDSSISASSEFGAALAALGEVNGEVHLAIGAPEQGNNGAVYIVTLNNDGSVKQLVRTIGGDGGADRPASPRNEDDLNHLMPECDFVSEPRELPGVSQKDRFGSSIAPLGDLNSDRRLDLAIGAPGWNDLMVIDTMPISGSGDRNCTIESNWGVIWTFQ